MSHFFVGIMRLQGYDNLPLSSLWIVVGLSTLVGLLGVWRVAILLGRWWYKPTNNASRLWKQLVRIHSLNRAEEKSMKLLAVRLGWGNGSSLFVDPSSWSWETRSSDLDIPAQTSAFEKVFGFPPG